MPPAAAFIESRAAARVYPGMKHLRISLYTPANPDTAVRAPWGTFTPGSNVLRVEHVSPDGVNRYTAAHEDGAGHQAPFDAQQVGYAASLAGALDWVQPAIQRAYRLGVQDLAAALDVALAGSGEPAAGVVDKLVRALLDEPFVGGEAPALVGAAAPGDAPAVDYLVTELREAAEQFKRAELHDDMLIREVPALLLRAAGRIASMST